MEKKGKSLKALKAQKNSLYRNINIKKKTGKSKPKSKSTVSAQSWASMKAGFPKSKKRA